MTTFNTLEKATLRHIASIAWPMGLNAVLMQSVIIVDVLLIASLGDVSIAAFGLGGAIITFVINIQFAFGNGTQLLLSRAAGTGDIKKLGIGVASGWVLSVGFSLMAIIILFFGTDPIIHFISHDDEVASLAIEYIEISLLVILFSSFSNVAVSYFNALKKTRVPLYGFMLEVPINIVCSAMLIHGLWAAPQLGLAGAAWGSAIATALRLIYLAYQFNQERIHGHVAGFIDLNRRIITVNFHEIIPIVANFIVLFGGLLMFHVLFSQLSVPSYAAISLILPWIKVGSLFVNSWTQSSTILVSQKLGKNDLKTIPQLVSQSKFVSIIMCIIMVFGFYLFSLFIPHLFKELSAETITALAIIAPIYILIPVFRVNNMFCGNMIRAMGESYTIVRINIITQWLIALPTCALLIYLEAPLFWVFGVILMDEILKFIPFRKTMARLLNRYA